MKRNPEVGGVFLGEGPQVPTGPQILFAGRVPHADVPVWLSAADPFVLPTRAEGSPNAALEALACGLPLISSRIPSLEETIDASCVLLVDPGNVDSMAEKIALLVDGTELRARMAAAAHARGTASTLSARVQKILTWLDGLQRRYAEDHAKSGEAGSSGLTG